jgi:hypothetical protein
VDDIVMKILMDDLSTPLPSAAPNKERKNKQLIKAKVKERTGDLMEAVGLAKKPRMMVQPFPRAHSSGTVHDSELLSPSPLALDQRNPFEQHDLFASSPVRASPQSASGSMSPATPSRIFPFPAPIPPSDDSAVVFEDALNEEQRLRTISPPPGFNLLNPRLRSPRRDSTIPFNGQRLLGSSLATTSSNDENIPPPASNRGELASTISRQVTLRSLTDHDDDTLVAHDNSQSSLSAAQDEEIEDSNMNVNANTTDGAF